MLSTALISATQQGRFLALNSTRRRSVAFPGSKFRSRRCSSRPPLPTFVCPSVCTVSFATICSQWTPSIAPITNTSFGVQKKAKFKLVQIAKAVTDQRSRKSMATESFTVQQNHSKSPSETPQLSSLCDYATHILTTSNPTEKVALTERVVSLWKNGELKDIGKSQPPLEPPTPKEVQILSFRDMPKRGKGGKKRVALIHSLAHIEYMAINLSWDIIARFGGRPLSEITGEELPEGDDHFLPREFFDDFVAVAADEARHHSMLSERLKELSSYYGNLPAHSGLWDSAKATAENIMARLAIEHIVHEGRGLDVTPSTIQKLRDAGDNESAEMLEAILQEEVSHVTAGVRWFSYLCSALRKEPIPTFHNVVPKYFSGILKPPFNDHLRGVAGLSKDWYVPLSERREKLQCVG